MHNEKNYFLRDILMIKDVCIIILLMIKPQSLLIMKIYLPKLTRDMLVFPAPVGRAARSDPHHARQLPSSFESARSGCELQAIP